jgi:hypothetical protein
MLRGKNYRFGLNWNGMKAAGLMALLTACGPQAFEPTDIQNTVKGPGTYEVAPKVDIVIAQDDTGSMQSMYDKVKKGLPSLLSTLDGKSWDYRVTITPLTTQRSTVEVATSKFDGNYYSQGGWKEPYPGANPDDPRLSVRSDWFRLVNQFTFVSFKDSTNTQEQGFRNILNFLGRVRGDFLRDDAVLAVLVVGNGNDVSDYTKSIRAADGREIVTPAPLNNFVSEFSNLKYDKSMINFSAAVAFNSVNNCVGANTGMPKVGTRYLEMAKIFGGSRMDICTQSIPNILTSLSNSLQAVRMTYRTRYLVLDKKPNLDTLVLKKVFTDGGQMDLPRLPEAEAIADDNHFFDDRDGWSYVGERTDVYTVDQPTLMSPASGYIIKLHGDARLMGSEYIDVNFNMDGVAASMTK